MEQEKYKVSFSQGGKDYEANFSLSNDYERVTESDKISSVGDHVMSVAKRIDSQHEIERIQITKSKK